VGFVKGFVVDLKELIINFAVSFIVSFVGFIAGFITSFTVGFAASFVASFAVGFVVDFIVDFIGFKVENLPPFFVLKARISAQVQSNTKILKISI